MTDWHRDGFTVVENLLPTTNIDLILAAVAAQARKYRPADPAFAGARPWHSPEFDAALVRLRQEEPRQFGWLYDALQTNAAVMGLALSAPVARVAAALLEDSPAHLSATGAMLRLDAPADTRNRLDWHQERAYYAQNEDGRNGVVAWIALRDADESNGTIQLRPGSHREGFIPVGAADETPLVSQQFRAPDERLAGYPPVSVPVRAGTGVFFSFHLFHASGVNRSNRVRFTLGVRFHRSVSHDFKPGRLRYVTT